MSKTTTITATHNGVTFKRKTHRVYTHVIIGRLDVDALVRSSRRYAEESLRGAWDYYNEVANGTYKNMEYVSQENRDHHTKMVSLGLDGAIKLYADKAEVSARERAAKGWEQLAWAGRPDLAAKQVDEWKKPIHCYAEVLAIPVNA